MATWTLPSFRDWFLVLLLALASAALTGCRTSQGATKGCCGGPSAQKPAPTPLPLANAVPVSRDSTPPYGGQKMCPVTGDALGSMGPAIPVSLPSGQTIYVCCRGCANRVQRDPATYLRKVEAEKSSS